MRLTINGETRDLDAATVAEADALIAAAARGGLQLQVGHIERYNRAIRAAEPYLGGPRYIESQRLAPFQPRGTDVAVVLDLMIHDLDLVLHLTGGAEALGGRDAAGNLGHAHARGPRSAICSRTASCPQRRNSG